MPADGELPIRGNATVVLQQDRQIGVAAIAAELKGVQHYHGYMNLDGLARLSHCINSVIATRTTTGRFPNLYNAGHNPTPVADPQFRVRPCGDARRRVQA